MNSQRPLTVWLFPSAFAPHVGGVERVTEDLAHDLGALGHRVVILTNRHPQSLAAYERMSDLDVYRFVWPAPAMNPKAVLQAMVEGPKVLRRLSRLDVPPPDVVHVHCLSSQMPYAWWVARRTRSRLVVTTHGELTADANRLFLKSRWARWWAKRLLRDADAVTVPSARVREDAKAVGLALPVCAQVIPNGIDLDAWAGIPPAPTDPVVGAWGRLSPEKGFDLLLDAWPRVLAARPDASLWIAGDGPERPHLHKALPDSVTLLPALTHAELRQRLAGTRTVVVPSRAEAFGLVAAEAMAAGRVVVYAAGTAMDQTVGESGIATKATDPVDLARAIGQSLDKEPPTAVEPAPRRSAAVTMYEATYRQG